jgi:xylulokinase
LCCREAACLGAALLAGVAAGAYHSLDEAVSITVKEDGEFRPRIDLAKRYEERFKIYSDVYPALNHLNARL